MNNNQTCSLSPNSLIPLPVHTIHSLIDLPRQAMTAYSLYFDHSAMNASIIDTLFSDPTSLNVPIYYARQIRDNLRQLLHEQNHRPPGYQQSIQLYMNLTLLLAYRARLELSSRTSADKPIMPQTSVQRVQSVLNYIQKNFHEQFTLADSARMAQVSQRQFSTLCRKLCRLSLIQFINSLRCQQARHLLSTTDRSVSAIAFEVGFEELSSFYRAFKKHQRCTPLQFRSRTRS